MRAPAMAGLVMIGWLAACEGGEAPQLRLAGVTPAQGEDASAVTVEIEGEGFLPQVRSDFTGGGSGYQDGFSAWLVPAEPGLPEVALEGVERLSDRRLRATVPAGPVRGFYGVRLVDPRGRQALLPEIYRVVRSAGHVAGFRVEPIVAQRAGVPFLAQLTAVDAAGNPVDGFVGAVSLTDRTGSLSPSSLGPFALGRARGLITVAAPIAADQLEVRDAEGRTGRSNEFQVLAGRPARIAFASPPRTLTAGACSEPLVLELQDSLGQAAPAEARLALDFELSPPGAAALFLDAACTLPAEGAAVAAGSSSLQLHARATLAGPLAVRASSPSLPSALQTHQVSPLAPDRVAFGSASQVIRVGQCSSAIALRLEDRFGNLGPAAAATRLGLESQPEPSLSFFSDAGCLQPLSALELQAGESGAQLHARANEAGSCAVRAAPEAPSVLSAGALTLTVTP